MILIHLSHIKSFAFECQARFLETRVTQIGKTGRQTCRSHLINLPSRLRTANLMSGLMLFPQEGKRESALRIDKLAGITFRTDKDEHYRLVPQEAYAPPTRRHHVELVLVAGAYQHPLFSDDLYKIVFDQTRFYCLHNFTP